MTPLKISVTLCNIPLSCVEVPENLVKSRFSSKNARSELRADASSSCGERESNYFERATESNMIALFKLTSYQWILAQRRETAQELRHCCRALGAHQCCHPFFAQFDALQAKKDEKDETNAQRKARKTTATSLSCSSVISQAVPT